jgi:hypothetical protein
MHIPKKGKQNTTFFTQVLSILCTLCYLYTPNRYNSVWFFCGRTFTTCEITNFTTLTFLTCTENDCVCFSCNGENVLWHMVEWLTKCVWRNLRLMTYYYERRTTQYCSTLFRMLEVQKCIKLERSSYKMCYRSKNTFFDKMIEYGTKILYYFFYLMQILWCMEYEPV